MLAAPYRLRATRDINRVYSKGRYTSAGPITVKALSSRAQSSRAVVVVSKKVSKKAVVRNRIRRRLSAELASRWATVAPGYDIVVTVRDDLSQAPATDVKGWLKTALTRLELI